MEPIDMVQILKEHDTLRAEILQRIAHRFAFLGLTGAGGAYVFFALKFKGLAIYKVIALVIAAVAVPAVWDELLVWEHEKRGSVLFHKIYK